MTDQNVSIAEASSIDEELVAYLDGELDAAEAARVERRLAEDASYRARLAQLQKAWDLLDTLQRSEADDELVHSTVAMVAVQAAEDAKSQGMQIIRRRNLGRLVVAALGLLTITVGYVAVQRLTTREDRRLVGDLPVIERVDEYRNIDNLEFLKQLESENLFPAEVDDGT
jgi:anti-sigma factor RsiW